MKGYNKSDYALNKFSKSIIYKSVTGKIIEISKDTFLASDPALTEQDFDIWKAVSDEIFLETDRSDWLEGRCVSINELEETTNCSVSPLDDEYIKIQNQNYTIQAVREALRSGLLTPKQHRRFVLYRFKGLTIRKIAEMEGVCFPSVQESLVVASKKLKHYFEKL